MARGPKPGQPSDASPWKTWVFPQGETEAVKAEFGRLHANLASAGLLDRADPALVLEASRLKSRMDKANREIEKEGMTIVTKNGFTMKNPLLSYVNESITRLRLIYKSLGLTSDSKVKAGMATPEEGDPWSGLIVAG